MAKGVSQSPVPILRFLVLVVLLSTVGMRGQTKPAAPRATDSGGVILVDTDDSCHLVLDGKDQGIVKPDETKRISVSLGDHILKCTLEGSPDLVWRKVIAVKDSEQVAALIELKELHGQHADATAKPENGRSGAPTSSGGTTGPQALAGHGTAVTESSGDRLMTSTLIIGDAYAPGQTEIRPRAGPGDGRPASFKQDQNVGFWMQVYNPGVDDKTHRTSVAVEYDVVDVATNKTLLNTYERHEYPGGPVTLRKNISTASLQFGSYKIEIHITDNVSKQTVDRSAVFVVEPTATPGIIADEAALTLDTVVLYVAEHRYEDVATLLQKYGHSFDLSGTAKYVLQDLGTPQNILKIIGATAPTSVLREAMGGNLALLEKETRRLLANDPENAVLHVTLGNLLRPQIPCMNSVAPTPSCSLSDSRTAEMLAEYRKAIQLKPNASYAHFSLGLWISRVPDKQQESLAELREAVRLEPSVAVYHSRLSDEYQVVNDPLDAQKEFAESYRLRHTGSERSAVALTSSGGGAVVPTAAQAATTRYDDVTGQPAWTCRAEELGPGYGVDGTDIVDITFNADSSMVPSESAAYTGEPNRHLVWVFDENQWTRDGSTVSWDPQTNFVFTGTVNGDNTEIAGNWSNASESESGPLVCQRPTPVNLPSGNPPTNVASNQSYQSPSPARRAPMRHPSPVAPPAQNSNPTTDAEQSALDNNCLVRDPEPWQVGDKKTVAVLKLRNTCSKPLSVSFCFKSPGDQCWKCTHISVDAGQSATSNDLVPGCTTSNCSEVQAIYNVGTQKPNVDDSCVGAVH